MPTRERPGDRGRQRGERLLRDLVEEIRRARLASNLSQSDVGRAVGLSRSRVSLIERGRHADVPFTAIAHFLGVLGLELSARAYPVGGGLRDASQARLLGRLRARTPSGVQWQTEVPIPGDLRAWDAVLRVGQTSIGVDAETRVRDFQAVDRRTMLKARDSAVDLVILLIARTRSNRAALHEGGTIARLNYPISSTEALAALAGGRAPGGNAIVML
jgi:transcriptional regulator with XRE-family HTH domain